MSDDNDFSLPETHIERMDRLAFERDTQERQLKIQAERDIKVAKERRKSARSGTWLGIGVAFAAAAVMIACVYAWWIDEEPVTPDNFITSEAGREARCLDNGGGWVPDDLIVSGDSGLCVYPGRQAEVPAE